jgi:cellulose biosynthesis protein BcsQ
VGKTTLACNVASYIAEHQGLSVLVVDADPQCNATQLILPDDVISELYRSSSSEIDTLRDVLNPLNVGEATLDPDITTATPGTNRFGVSVLPGHPKLALLEDTLSQSWTTFIGGGIGGARVTNWNTQLLTKIQSRFDLIIYDVGPSLGALNRSVLVGVDYFVAPMGCDIFSLIGIANIGDWLHQWQDSYDQALAQCRKNHGHQIEEYQVRTDSNQMSRFLGYTVQQYITKTIREKRRATSAYEEILNEIPVKVEETLTGAMAVGLAMPELRLGDVPHMYSLVPLAQSKRTPIHGLTGRDGLSGGQYAQQEDYKLFIANLSNSLLTNLRKATGEDGRN